MLFSSTIQSIKHYGSVRADLQVRPLDSASQADRAHKLLVHLWTNVFRSLSTILIGFASCPVLPSVQPHESSDRALAFYATTATAGVLRFSLADSPLIEAASTSPSQA